ncbi:MAG: DUF6702 family protein [Acidobacteriota bacterium]
MKSLRWSVVLLGLSAMSAEAHRFHASFAEAEHDAERRSLEVALRVEDHDLEDALRLRHGREYELTAGPVGERMARAYVEEHFILARPGGQPLELEWVGWDWSRGSTWLYFEYPLSGDPGDLHLTNTLFLELSREQVNTVNVRVGKALHTLTFLARSTRHHLGLPQASASSGPASGRR